MSRKSKRFANRGIQVPSGTTVEQDDQGDTEHVELVTPGVRSAESERSKERASLAVSVEEVEDGGSEGDGSDNEEDDKEKCELRILEFTLVSSNADHLQQVQN
ncbi:hypothetical protein CYLTODRAFT_119219 [Cylindrobasidium torrendii FP15055 ss-10]|uniref:Uncharacterized protein n=1 Tax=Cylindrobasidium torrendii FP15055 ss-10 TaxID=1314674 RepID=A0A0D7B1B4_9AGAR|nr:hypothetical protein CYLTODRAFT_119219 [Cylindrobasidium torrendii FP15055 ss-10]